MIWCLVSDLSLFCFAFLHWRLEYFTSHKEEMIQQFVCKEFQSKSMSLLNIEGRNFRSMLDLISAATQVGRIFFFTNPFILLIKSLI
jgi:hypothetical protein